MTGKKQLLQPKLPNNDKSMEQDKSFIDRIQAYLQENPGQFGWILVVVGAVFLWGSIQKWAWIFQGDGRIFNIAWFREQFGDKAAQTAFGLFSVIVMIIGICWVLLFKN